MTTPPATLPLFEIFAPGTHVAMNGEAMTFAAADLSATAVAYDPALMQAPLCVGHPKHDLPAYGWVKGLSVVDGRLVADTEQVDAAFAAAVEAGRFKARSAAFFHPDAANNPVPGTWYLRHVAFLGAAVPAVAGLKPIAFADGDDGVVLFSAVEPGRLAWSIRNIGALMRGFRDFLIETAGVEKADTLAPSWRLDDLAADAARLDEIPAPTFSAPAPDPEDPVTVKTPDPAELTRREAELAQREAQFAARAAEARRADDTTFLDGLVKQGRLASGLKDDVAAFMATLDSSAAVSFAAAGAAVEKTPHQAFRDLLSRLPTLVEFRELAGDDGKAADTAAFAAPSGYHADPEALRVHAEATAYQRKHPGTDYLTAVAAVQGR